MIRRVVEKRFKVFSEIKLSGGRSLKMFLQIRDFNFSLIFIYFYLRVLELNWTENFVFDA